MIDVILTCSEDTKARIVVINDRKAFISLESGRSEASLFLPRDVPADKLQTIVDAINDALDTVRAPKSEAA